ncbi:Endonuclease/exonuclease/phosphatase [Russula vinacea]|nr:Endonuclease/exonuclease/phosphatase [Russula vinacea]
MPATFTPTPEQLALREARRLKKDKAATNAGVASSSLVNNEKGQIVPRPWLAIQDSPTNGTRPVKIMTWNLLAQCLVRRELFPNCGCLKSSQREPMLYKEILSADADVLCLQEVDRLEKLIPVLEGANYDHVYASGPGKKHGCLIGFRKDSLGIRDQFVLHYDDTDTRADGTELSRKGVSFRTKNIANVVTLERLGQPGEGFIVATTHLFWHPSYAYERARQAGILLRKVVKYREDSRLLSWPCFLAGDFNFSPAEPGYALLVGDTLTTAQEELLEKSRVVHVSVDPTVPLTNPFAINDDEDGGALADPDKVITNAREASPADGLLKSSELVDLFAVTALHPRSLYDEGQRLLEKNLAQFLAAVSGSDYRLINEARMNRNGQAIHTTGRTCWITFGLSILPTEERLLCACSATHNRNPPPWTPSQRDIWKRSRVTCSRSSMGQRCHYLVNTACVLL